MENTKLQGTNSWPELAATLLEKLTSSGVNPEVSLDFDNMEVQGGADQQQQRWRVNGSLTIRTRNASGNAQ